MDETKGFEFIDKQIDFNKDIVKASTTMLDGLNRQAKVNEAVAERLRDQDDQIATIRQLVIGLTIGLAGTAIGLVFLVLA